MVETGHYIQLAIAIIIAVIAFVGASLAPLRFVLPVVLVIAPFEIINSRYGTSSTGLIYLVTLALLLRNGFKWFPLFGVVAGIAMVYLISLSMADVSRLDHILYIIRILPGFMIFYMAYNYVRDSKDIAGFLNVLLIINVFILIICLLQLIGGSQQVALFGVKEFAIMANREAQGRLSGPFGAEFTSEYLALSNLLLAYLIMNRRLELRWPIWLWIHGCHR